MKIPLSFALASVLLFPFSPLIHADETGSPDRWSKDMAAFEDRDATTPPPTDALLFTGSSSIRMWDLPGSWPNHKTINNGFGGSTLPDVIARFDRLVRPYDARAVIIYSGDNDIKTGQSAAEVIASVRAFHALAAAAKPGVPVIFIAVKPSTARWNLWPVMKEVNEAMASMEGELADFYYADIASQMLPENGEAPGPEWFKKDGLHLSELGYAGWTSIVNEALKRARAL